ncbi:MAG TPA: NUDIX domain-containing protein [Patescibacteria group bacterium]
MIKTALGFIFTPDFKQVLLIGKNRPQWQVGKINGVGGKCEANESFEECISREVKEEANVLIPPAKWREIATLHWQEWEAKVLAAIWSGSVNEVKSLTDEKVAWFPVSQLPSNVMANLKWLIPLSIDALQTQEIAVVEVHYE